MNKTSVADGTASVQAPNRPNAAALAVALLEAAERKRVAMRHASDSIAAHDAAIRDMEETRTSFIKALGWDDKTDVMVVLAHALVEIDRLKQEAAS